MRDLEKRLERAEAATGSRGRRIWVRYQNEDGTPVDPSLYGSCGPKSVEPDGEPGPNDITIVVDCARRPPSWQTDGSPLTPGFGTPMAYVTRILTGPLRGF